MQKLLKFDSLILAVLIVIACLVRLDFLVPVNYVVDADEAIVGLMAKHINDGHEIPTFYYGQHYMGSLEPILVSFLFKLYGPSDVALKAVPLIFSLILIPLIYYLGIQVGGRFTGIAAAVLTAIPPNPLVVWSGKARGGFIEILVIGVIALILALHWLKPDQQKKRLTFTITLMLGLGWWVNNQIIYFIIPICYMFFAKLLIGREGTWKNNFKNSLPHFMIALSGFFIGGIPYWIYNFNHNFISFEILGSSSSKDLGKHFSGLFATSLPIIIGSKRFWAYEDIFPYSTLYFAPVYILLLLFVIWYRRTEIIRLFRFKLSENAGIELLLMFLLFTCLVFALSSYGYLVQAPRYLLPLYVGIAVLLGYALNLIGQRSRIICFSVLILVLAFNIFSNYAYGRNIPGEPFVYKEQRVSRDHTELIRWLESKNIHWVRTNYWIGYKLAFETNEKVKFDLFQEPTQLRIPEYRKEALNQTIEEIPFILVPAQAVLVQKAMKKLKYSFDTDFVNGYKIIYNIKLPRYDYVKVDPNLLSAESNYRNDISKLAVDGSAETRWGTAHPQNPEMKFEIKIAKPLHLVGLKYNLGTWAHDWPRALRIEVENSAGQVKEVFDDKAYVSIRYFTQDNACFSMFFDEENVVKIKLYQLSKDPVFDWSIAELTLLQAPDNQAS